MVEQLPVIIHAINGSLPNCGMSAPSATLPFICIKMCHFWRRELVRRIPLAENMPGVWALAGLEVIIGKKQKYR